MSSNYEWLLKNKQKIEKNKELTSIIAECFEAVIKSDFLNSTRLVTEGNNGRTRFIFDQISYDGIDLILKISQDEFWGYNFETLPELFSLYGELGAFENYKGNIEIPNFFGLVVYDEKFAGVLVEDVTKGKKHKIEEKQSENFQYLLIHSTPKRKVISDMKPCVNIPENLDAGEKYTKQEALIRITKC